MARQLPTSPPSAVQSPDRIQLALVITELSPGGAERCLVELATRIDREKFAPIVYSLGPPPAPDRQLLVQRLRDAEIPAHFLDLGSPWQYFSGVRRLAAKLREQRAEIVQTFLFHANVLGARAAQAAGVPHLVTNIRVADPRRWRMAVERWATSKADKLVCVSQGVKNYCRQAGFATDKLVVIPNGIDFVRWSEAPAADLTGFGIPAGRRVFMYVGRLDEQKGLDRFLPTLPQTFSALPFHDLLIVGEGKLRPALENLARELRIANRVHFAGWQHEICSILAAADLLVLPSRWEGMPNAVLEAMAAGKSVAAARAEGVVELLGDSADAQSAAVDDHEGLRVKLTEILSNPPMANDLGARNQARVRQLFSLASMIGQYEQLYFSLQKPS